MPKGAEEERQRVEAENQRENFQLDKTAIWQNLWPLLEEYNQPMAIQQGGSWINTLCSLISSQYLSLADVHQNPEFKGAQWSSPWIQSSRVGREELGVGLERKMEISSTCSHLFKFSLLPLIKCYPAESSYTSF